MEWRNIKQSLEKRSRGDPLLILGRVKEIRKHKERVFADIIDYSGNIQLVVEKS